MSKYSGNTGLIWTCVFVALVALVFLFAVKMLPDMRAGIISYGISMYVLSMIIIIIILLCIFGVTMAHLLWLSRRESEFEQEIIKEIEGIMGGEEGSEEEVLVAEIVDVVEEKEEKKKRIDIKKKYNIIEFPKRVEDGIFGDTFVKIDDKTLLKIRTKIAEESEI